MRLAKHYGPWALIAGASEGIGRAYARRMAEFLRLIAAKNLPVPNGVAEAEKFAVLGLERRPHGPIQDCGLKDDDAGYALLCASDRRKRVLAIEAVSTHVFGEARA